MDLREQRGLELAATRARSFRCNGTLWSVPSATGDGTRYSVDATAGRGKMRCFSRCWCRS